MALLPDDVRLRRLSLFFLSFAKSILTSFRSFRRAHQPMHINDWIEIDSDYKEQVLNSPSPL
jgi:hypothetical protein